MTIEQLWGLEPEPDPTPIREHTRRLAEVYADDWQGAQDAYERHLDRMGGNSDA